jgi:TP901 family phage tail tape measure protein
MDPKLLELQPSHYWTYTQRPAAERLADFQEALNKISQAAQRCGISIQEAVAATNLFAATGRNLSDAAGEAIKEISEKLKEQPQYETLKEEKDEVEMTYNIPRFNIDDYKINIE